VPCIGQTNDLMDTKMDNYELSPETAHVNARQLLDDNFYWSAVEESGPFGNDDGSDAFYGFRQWRLTNKHTSPLVFLSELIASWKYPKFDWNEMNSDKKRNTLNKMTNQKLLYRKSTWK
jgi:uncharacterized protein YfeS